MDGAAITIDEIVRKLGEQIGSRIESLETKVNQLSEQNEEILKDVASPRSLEECLERIAALEAEIATLATRADIKALRELMSRVQVRIDNLPVVSLEEA